jgi:putative peptide zinc metalloprotease protein
MRPGNTRPAPAQSPATLAAMERTLIAASWVEANETVIAASRLPIPSASDLRATMIRAGWRAADVTPLANLRVADLDATIMMPALRLPESPAAPAPATSSTPLVDLYATMAASGWAHLPATAADLLKTLISPRRVTPRQAAAHPLDDTIPASTRLGPPAAEPAPRLCAEVCLSGALRDSGFEAQQWLVRRGETFIQLSELLYRIVEHIDGARSLGEIAAIVAGATGRPVSANNVRLLIEARLAPLGIVAAADGAPPTSPAPSPRSPMAITLRLGVLGPRAIEPIARVLQSLYWPPLLVLTLALTLTGQAWLVLGHGAARPLRYLIAHPLMAFGVEAFVLLSAVVHEFGHASALRYGGGRARGMGFGFYLVSPAFYTDCTESYRLSRWGRLRTDLGGIYFDLIVALGLVVAYLATRHEVLLSAVVLLDLDMLDQFSPIMRFDGYWALADLVGVPDFYTLLRPVLTGMLPARFRKAQASRAPTLKGWVRVAFVGYTVVAVPSLVIILFGLLALAPGYLGFYADSLAVQLAQGIFAHRSGHGLELALALTQALILVAGAGILLYVLANLLRSIFRALWAWGRAIPARRAISLAVALAVIAVLGWQWVPQVAHLAPRVAALAHGLALLWSGAR